jgi:hypothetical protein
MQHLVHAHSECVVEIVMLQFGPSQPVILPTTSSSRLTHRRLRRPTPLPSLGGHVSMTSYLRRLLWRFSGA